MFPLQHRVEQFEQLARQRDERLAKLAARGDAQRFESKAPSLFRQLFGRLYGRQTQASGQRAVVTAAAGHDIQAA